MTRYFPILITAIIGATLIIVAVSVPSARSQNPCGNPEPEWRITTPSINDRPGTLRRCITISGVESCMD